MMLRCFFLLISTTVMKTPTTQGLVLSNAKHRNQNTFLKYPQSKLDLSGPVDYRDEFSEVDLPLPQQKIGGRGIPFISEDELLINKSPEADNGPICSLSDIQSGLSIEELNKLVQFLAKREGLQPQDVIQVLAVKNGLLLQNEETHGRSDNHPHGGSHSPNSPGYLPPREQSMFLSQGLLTTGGVISHNAPPAHIGGITMEDNVVTGTMGGSLHRVPQALLSIIGHGGEELGTTIVILAPRMGLLDTIKEAKITYALQTRKYMYNPFEYSLEVSNGCLTLASIGHLSATVTSRILVTVSSPGPEIKWHSSCLPRMSDLTIHDGQLIIISPSEH